MAAYKLTATSATVIRTADNANIPNDMKNCDRILYQQWLDGGGVPDPYVPPVGLAKEEPESKAESEEELGE